MGKTMSMRCAKCGMVFRSLTSVKSATSMRDRHVREAHANARKRSLAVGVRQRSDMYRKRLDRLLAGFDAGENPPPVRVYVLCPIRRAFGLGLFAGAREAFARIGVSPSAVRRTQGFDIVQKPHVRRFRRWMPYSPRVPKPEDVVTAALLRCFIPCAARAFRDNQDLRYVLFAEDDCRFRRKLKASVLLTAAADAGDRAAWLGYPKVGAHLLSFNHVAMAAFREHAAKEMASRPFALDALLNRLWRQGLVYAPGVSLAQQMKHAAVGRR